MSYDSLGYASCEYCHAEFRLFTIFKKDMGGLAKAWKRRHERKCKNRTPSQRRQWARPYIGKSSVDSSIVVDIEHSAFKDLP